MEKGNKKIINAWAMYDWANSVYPLVINTAIFPIYYNAVAGDKVMFFGTELKSAALYSYTLAISYLVTALITPILSGIADYSGNKKRFMQFFCYLGALSCAGLYFFSMQNLMVGLFFVMMASIGWAGSIVFYNAYLPEIAEPKDHDRVSAKGYSMGYIGSVLLLIFNLVMMLMPDLFFDVAGKVQTVLAEQPALTEALALDEAEDYFKVVAARISFITVGVWWIGFSQITFFTLPNNVFNRKPTGNVFSKGFEELSKVWRELQEKVVLKRFLLSFFLYSMGVQTLMLMAPLYGAQEVGLESTELIITVLIIQLIAIPGAYGFSYLSSRIGNFKTIAIALLVWIGVCIAAYFVRIPLDFYILAFFVGLTMGGIQSLSRSTYSKILPETVDHASYFSFYDICEKVGIVIGMASYGYLVQLTGSMRNSVFALMVFFILGLLVLRTIVKSDKKSVAA